MPETHERAARIVVHYTDASSFGGAEQMIVNLLRRLDRRRWTPTLLHHDEAGLQELVERTREIGVSTAEVPRSGGRSAIGRYLRGTRPALFHAHLNWPLACTTGLFAAALARIPAIATQQLFVPIQSRRRRLQQKFVSALVGRYVAVSGDMAAMLRRACLFGDAKVEVVHNGIDLESFGKPASASLRESLSPGDGRPLVLTLARLAPQKGLPHLIDAAVRVPDALFLLAGDGSEREALEARVRAQGVEDRVRFLGHRRDVPELLASCDIFVLPSLYEGLPVSLLEAMAAGRPVIATRIGGTDEAVENGTTGLLVPPADAEALAAAIRRLLDDGALARRLADRGRARVRTEFSAETAAARTMNIYAELAGAA